MSQVVIGDILPYTQATAILNQTVFGTNWTADVESDVVVYVTPAGDEPNDVTQILSYPSQYSVTFVGALEQVQVTLVTPSAAGDIVTVTRQTPAERLNLYTNTNFLPSMLNNDFGILTLVDQQAQLVDQKIGPRYNYSAIIVDVVDTILPILGANETWVKNPSNTAIIPYVLPSGGIAPADATYVTGSDETSVLPNSFQMFGTANEITLTLASNQAILSFPINMVIPGTGSVGLPGGTTAQRVITAGGTPLRYNSDLDSLEFFSSGTWSQLNDDTDGNILPGLQNDLGYYAAAGITISPLTTPATVGQILQTNNPSPPTWSTATYPSTTTINQLLYSSSNNVIAGLATANNGVLITSIAGVPSISSTLPTAVQDNITQLGAQAEALNMNTHLINSVVDPVSAQDAATKNYVDTLIANFAVIFVARLATTTNLAWTYANGSAGVGATLTNSAPGTFSFDGVTVGLNNLVLVKNQSSTFQNGYYRCTNDGSVTAAVLTRSTDYDTPSEINPGDLFVITAGSTQANTTWIETSTVTAVGTDPITFSQFSVALPIPVSSGGTGNTTFTAYSVICAGTTATGPFQNVSGLGTAGQVLKSNGAGALPSWQASGSVFSINIQTFTGSGTYTPTANMIFCIIEAVSGGGGGGSGTFAAANNQACGAGGGGGGYGLLFANAATIGASQSVTIGAAGTGGAPGNGTAGGTTSVGALLSITGGGFGTGGTNSAPPNLTYPAGLGGTSSGGTINIDGGEGESGGVYGNGALYQGGGGGSSMFSPSNLSRTYNNGTTIVGYGGGGTGGRPGDGVASNGRDGTAGFVKITEFIAA